MPRRSIVGVLLAALIGGVAVYWLGAGAGAYLTREAQVREARLELAMLADLAGRVSDGEALQAALARRTEASGLTSIRIVRGRDLAASTHPDDVGERAAPRRLERDEKPLFDAARALAAAVENNRDPNAPRKDEVLVETLDDGSLQLSAPVEIDGEVDGMVVAQRPRPEGRARPSLLWLLLGVGLPVVVVAVLARLIGDRRGLLALIGGVAVAVAVGGVGAAVWNGIAERGREAAGSLAKHAAEAGDFARVELARADVVEIPELDPAAWDTDSLRRSRGLLSDGGFDEAALDAELASSRTTYRRGVIILVVLAMAIALFVILGGAEKTWSTVRRHREAYAYTTPALVGMLILVFFPFLYGIGISFTNQNVYNVDQQIWDIWIGFDNYVDILTDVEVLRTAEDGTRAWNYNNFYFTLVFTIIWTVTNVTIGVSVGLFLALILNTKGLRMRPIYRVLLILPWAVPNYITALIWKGMFHQQFGVVNQVLQMFGGEPVRWFEGPVSSFVTILATNGWLSFPFMMVICLGALQSIPADLYEAARVDGATRWQQFLGITLPSLKPALVPAVILSVVWTFNMFNIPYLVSQGEPAGATEILITDAYKIAFEQYRYGYAAAYSTVIFGILLVYGWWQNRVTRATEGI